MVDKELIEIWRNMLKPSISSRLLKTNYEGMGEQDKEEFERDFDEILDLALIGLKYKAQLSQERTETHTCDSIGRQVAIDAVDAIGHIATMPDGDKCIRRSAVKYTLSMLPPAQPEQRWIPCSERLPDTNRDVLLQFSASMGVGFWEHNSWGVNTGDNIYSGIDEGEAQPIAWCELPEQYQGGGEQE